MNTLKKWLALALCFVLLCTLLPRLSLTAHAEVYSGTCGAEGDGSNLTWTLDTETGLLTIEGSGAMKDWAYASSAPWYSFRSSILAVSLPDGVTSIGAYAFFKCKGLTSITIPNSVTNIGTSAFEECSNLSGIAIPNGVNTIGGSAFFFCKSLSWVSIPITVVAIGFGAFDGCSVLERVYISDLEQWCKIDFNTDFDWFSSNPLNSGADLYLNGVLLNDPVIPESISVILPATFAGCNCNTVFLHDNVTTISSFSFARSSLSYISLPANVQTIESGAFDVCDNLSIIVINNPDCLIMDSYGGNYNTLGGSSDTTIYGYPNSTAEAYANKYGYQFELISNYSPYPKLSDEITHLIFADMAYARIPADCEGDTVEEWLEKKTYQSIPADSAGYDESEMVAPIFRSSVMNRIAVYKMVGDWRIVDVVDGEAGFAAVVFQKGDEIIIAYRGSEEGPGSILQGEDWWVDAEFAIFNLLDSRQFGAALDTYRAYEQSGKNVTLCGHSLGGALVTYVSILTGAKGYSFDGAAGHVIDLVYLYEPLNIDFHSKDQMNFTNYTDLKSMDHLGADLIQHTNEDLFPGVCYYTNEDAIPYYNELFWTHQQYSNTSPSKSGRALEFMPLAEEHHPKENWYASVDYQYLGIATGGITGLCVGLFGEKANLLSVLKDTWKGVSWGNKIGRLMKKGSVHLGTEGNDRISVYSNITSILDISALISENVIYGGDGVDYLIGAASSDILIPGDSDGDTLCGGLGNDIYLLDISKSGVVIISDSSGNDSIITKSTDIPEITSLGYNEDLNSYGFRIGEHYIVYLTKTAKHHSFCVTNSESLVLGFLDSSGDPDYLGNQTLLRSTDQEAGSKEVGVEGLCTVRIYDPNGELAAEYSTDEPGFYPTGFGSINITVEEGACLLTGTIYEDYTMKVDGDDSVDIAIIGTDEDNYVNRSTIAEAIDLQEGETDVIPEQHLVTQAGKEVAAQDQMRSVSVAINESALTAAVGDTLGLTAEAVFADGTTSDNVCWISMNPDVVTCEKDENGAWIITAIEAGEADLYAVAEDSGFSACCTVTAEYRLPCSGGVSCAGKHFTDMPEKGNWAHDPIDWAIVNEITSGTSATTFSPKKPCTREQIVTFLWKAKGAPEPTSTENPFSDVKAGKYYYKAVLWAVENEITGGVSTDKFGVGKPCTREQAMTFLWKAAGAPEPTSAENPFTDVNTEKYYAKAVLWAVENGITSGTSATTFGVGKTCTRAQIVTFLYKTVAGE